MWFSPSWISRPCKISAAVLTIVMCLRTSPYAWRVRPEEPDSAVILEFLGQITKTSYSNIKHAPKRKRSTRLVLPKLPSLDFRRRSLRKLYCTSLEKMSKAKITPGFLNDWLYIHNDLSIWTSFQIRTSQKDQSQNMHPYQGIPANPPQHTYLKAGKGITESCTGTCTKSASKFGVLLSGLHIHMERKRRREWIAVHMKISVVLPVF